MEPNEPPLDPPLLIPQTHQNLWGTNIFSTACLQTMTLTPGSIKNTSETKLAENCFFISYDCYAQSSMKIIDL